MSLNDSRDSLARVLVKHDLKIVFAESCTAGLCAATLSHVPGISNHHCGSAVTYRPETKKVWLWVKANSIKKHTCESEQVADEMACGVLARTKEANWSVSIVGHFGPGAPDDKDGMVWIAVCRRTNRDRLKPMGVTQMKLKGKTRLSRQKEAAEKVFDTVTKEIRRQYTNQSD